MKTKNLLLVLLPFFLLCINLSAQNISFEWAKQMGGTNSYSSGNSITTDANGNLYSTGELWGTIDFDPGTDINNLTSSGKSDIYIQKLDVNGDFLWVKHMGGALNDRGFAIVTDSNGNVFTTGSFEGTVDFDPGDGTSNLTSAGEEDIFIQKLDADGNFLWAKQMGGVEDDLGEFISVDMNGNVYTIGVFEETADFGNVAGSSTLSAAGREDIFIQKLDTNGNLIWIKQLGAQSADKGFSITTDEGGNVYCTGLFSDTVDFDPGDETVNLTSAGLTDIFIQKFDTNGNFIWVKQMGGSSADGGSCITTDASGNIYTIGYFAGTADFGPGTGLTNFTSAGGLDIFIQKLDANGELLWAKQMGGIRNDYAKSITSDANGDLYITGNFDSTVDFDPGTGTSNLISTGRDDIFILKLDTDGDFLWVGQMGGTEYDNAFSITIDATGNLYTTGYFTGSVDFDPGSETSILSSAGYSDIFIQKLSQTTVGLSENSFSENDVVYPNPTTGNFAIKFETVHKDLSVRITSVSGQTIETKTFKNTDVVQMQLEQPDGIYLVELINAEGFKTGFRLIKE